MRRREQIKKLPTKSLADPEISQATTNFGLIDREYPTDKHFDPKGEKSQWQRFEAWLSYLNSGCHKDGSVTYKILFMGRHGEGWHNAAESFYGTPAWNVRPPSFGFAWPPLLQDWPHERGTRIANGGVVLLG